MEMEAEHVTELGYHTVLIHTMKWAIEKYVNKKLKVHTERDTRSIINWYSIVSKKGKDACEGNRFNRAAIHSLVPHTNAQ